MHEFIYNISENLRINDDKQGPGYMVIRSHTYKKCDSKSESGNYLKMAQHLMISLIVVPMVQQTTRLKDMILI